MQDTTAELWPSARLIHSLRVQTRLLEIFRSLLRFPVWPGLPSLYITSDNLSEETPCPSASLTEKNWPATFLTP